MFKRAAFTMIELVMVIVVMGIVASIGADIIVNLYENYIKTRAINKLQSQSELVLDQIAKRLDSRIKDSVIARDKSTFINYVALTDANDSYQILEWIGKDTESFKGISNPGWSGFIDLDNPATTKPNLITSGSELNTTSIIINALSYGDISLLPTDQNPAIIFKGQANLDLAQYGWGGSKGNHTLRVTRLNNTTLLLKDANATFPDEISEQYDLAWSAYALVPEGSANDFNLTLYYNYQPWEDEQYNDINTSSSVIMEHVSTFKFTKIGDTIRLKLCIHDNNQSGNYDFAFCKEKVIY